MTSISTQQDFPDDLVDYVRPADQRHYTEEHAKADSAGASRLCGARDFPNSLWIEPSQWKQVSEELDRLEISAEHLRNRYSNQSPTHECTAHSLSQGFEAAWNAQRLFAGRPVFVSMLSIYAEANPREWGGASCLGVLRIAQERGFLPEHAGPDSLDQQTKLYKHTIHGTAGKGNSKNSAGDWLPMGDFPSGWKDTAKHFKPAEVIEPESADQAVCLMLHSRIINVGRSGHAVPWNRAVWRGGSDSDPRSGLHAAYPDSYDVTRFDSYSTMRRAIGGSSCIFTTTVPDRWDRPAGQDMKGFTL